MCLAKYVGFDEMDAWCGQVDHCDIADLGNISKVDCQDCFEAVKMYWDTVREQWQEVGPW